MVNLTSCQIIYRLPTRHCNNFADIDTFLILKIINCSNDGSRGNFCQKLITAMNHYKNMHMFADIINLK